jgi:hypothetical protein
MQTKQEVLKSCTISGHIVKLPDIQLDRKLYQEVAKSLELIGGKWNRKAAGFVFNEDPTSLLGQVSNGVKRNLKKEYQYFGTTQILARGVVKDANLTSDDLLVMEPSAGQGAIIKEILRERPGLTVHYFELMDVNRKFLEKIPNTVSLGKNFLTEVTALCYMRFDRIIANPPFSKNQDIDHICQMYLCLKPGGRMVTFSSKHWQIGPEQKCQQFREWMQEINADVTEVEAGAFKESGTTIPTVKIIIDK